MAFVCLESPYTETYREFIAFTTSLYDKVPSFPPPTPTVRFLSVSQCPLCVTLALSLVAFLTFFPPSLLTFPSFFLFYLAMYPYFSTSASLCMASSISPVSSTCYYFLSGV